MATYQITCVDRSDTHGQITHVGINGQHGTWTVDYVRRLIAQGSTFFTISPSTHRRAGVSVFDAEQVGKTVETLRSAPDAIEDNDIDNLRACSFTRS